ncbi:hypothetical protein SAMN05878482_11153 [Peribacillus simplex]|uniref:Uncharacterized protein n=2 Tax=Peribacillus TaxID=2675229 RepID=A0A9X8RE44_9BACI|nr:hypothetical protein [Peribacillus simplex]SIS06031.1 hypothetical protein SAMN05878482_11153 [Peribacillus simplex]
MLFHLIIDGKGGGRMMHFLLNLITDMGKEIFVAVATSLILSAFAKKRKKNHSSSQDRSGSSSDQD